MISILTSACVDPLGFTYTEYRVLAINQVKELVEVWRGAKIVNGPQLKRYRNVSITFDMEWLAPTKLSNEA